MPLVLVVLLALGRWQTPAQSPPAETPLRPTVHAALPQNVDDYWFAPAAAQRAASRGNSRLADAAASYAAGDYYAALAAARQALAAGGPLEIYAQYYVGAAQLRLNNADEAVKAFDAVLARQPEGQLSVSAALGKAEAAEIRGDHAAALAQYEALAANKSIAPEDILSRLARAALAAGNRSRAAEAYVKIYYEFPLSDAAAAAEAAMASLQDLIVRKDYKADLGRALILFGAKRYADARTLLLDIQKQASGDDREIIDLRIAESEYFLKRYAYARDGVRPYLDQASRKAEAKFFYLSALRGLGDDDEANRLTTELAAEFPDSSWSSEALNNLGTHYIVTNQDDLAAQTFKDLFAKFPAGPHAERAAWKYGWWAYTTRNYAETARVFENAAGAFPRSDYRPSWLYWSARAREKLGQRQLAEARMRLVHADYLHSYYGRLAAARLAPARAGNPPVDGGSVVAASLESAPSSTAIAPPPTAALIRNLLAAGLYDDAMNELRYAQKAWATSPAIEATIAWIYHQKGDLRRAITLMRRAYPQFLSSGGDAVPAEILQVIFPLTYWDAIKRQAAIYELDPYVIAALIAQESTFDPNARSVANAWGLMQIVPRTGRRLATAVGIRRFSTSMLTNGETNIRLGTLYFKRLVTQFGGTHYALASYNAGENRVVRWKAERPGMDEDEFIDDIPFPETQNYVKRILGTAEDYRRLYGDGEIKPRPAPRSTAKPSTSKRPAARPKAKAPAKNAPVKKAPAKKPVRRPGGGQG
jgi:soluble lytic murein transglycosylase